MYDKISHEKLKELVSYDESTGLFLWKVSRQRCIANKNIGYRHYSGYLHVEIFGKHYSLHRLAWFYVHGEWPKDMLDHINNIRDDNRISNLREVNVQQNSMNRSPNKKGASKYKGVTWHGRTNTWRARISLNNKRISLGLFKTEEDAYAAYKEAALQYHGEFANTGE